MKLRKQPRKSHRAISAAAAESALAEVVDHNQRKFDATQVEIESGLNDVYRKLGLPEPYPKEAR